MVWLVRLAILLITGVRGCTAAWRGTSKEGVNNSNNDGVKAIAFQGLNPTGTEILPTNGRRFTITQEKMENNKSHSHNNAKKDSGIWNHGYLSWVFVA